MLSLIPSHRGRPSDDPIFSLNRDASDRSRRGESVVNATIGVLLDDHGALALLPTAIRMVREVSPLTWAAYAPIAGPPDFLRAVVHEVLATDEAGRRVVTFRMFDDAGAFDVPAFDRALGERLDEQGRALVFLNDPCQNPTGYSMTPEDWNAVVDVILHHAARGPVVLLIDCAYASYAAEQAVSPLAALRRLVGKVAVLFAWSASKTFTHYGLRVGALIACVGPPDARHARANVESALSYACRGTWSNCNAGGMSAITRLLVEPELRLACKVERDLLRQNLAQRVDAFNRLARSRGLRYPRYDGGFFVTVFEEDASGKAARLRQQGVFVVPQTGGLRVALCAVSEQQVPRLVDALASV